MQDNLQLAWSSQPGKLAMIVQLEGTYRNSFRNRSFSAINNYEQFVASGLFKSQKVAVSSRDDGSVLSVLRSVFISTVGEGIRIPPPDK